nr:MAG TPA: hypothetical protein [Caudoviricetes sp.]
MRSISVVHLLGFACIELVFWSRSSRRYLDSGGILLGA